MNTATKLILALLLCLPQAAISADYRCRDGASPPDLHEGETLRVASLNIAHGRGSSLNQMLIGRERIEANLERAAAAMRDTGAHLVALQELDVDSRWAGNFDHADWLLDNSHLDCVAIGLHARTWLYQFGTGLMSEMHLTDPKTNSFEPTPPTTNKGLVAATMHWRTSLGERAVRVASVHLDFSRKGARERQLDAVIADVKSSPVPIIVMGDFNEQWDSNGSVITRLVEEGGLVVHRPEAVDLPSYKTKRLDWILVSSELEFLDYHVVQEELSDHRLVVAELRWREEP